MRFALSGPDRRERHESSAGTTGAGSSPGGQEVAADAGADVDGRCVALIEKAETVTTQADVASLPPDPAVRRTPLRRRPTGAPPPLPHPVSVTTRAWLVLTVVVLAGVIVISVRAPSLRLDNQVNSAVLRLSRGPGHRG